MTTIRERDASFVRLVAEHLGEAFLCAGVAEDRRALLIAGDALAEAADKVLWPWPKRKAAAEPQTHLLAAIARWREVTG